MIPSAFGHTSTWVPMLVVTVMGICAILAYGLASRAVRRAIQGNDAALDRALETALQRPSKEPRPLSEQLLIPLASLL